MLASNIKTVRNDLWSLIKDAQDLFREATSLTGEKADSLRNRGLNVLDTALTRAQDAQTVAVGAGKDMAITADDYVHQNPWKAVAMSAGVGVLIGMLLVRRV